MNAAHPPGATRDRSGARDGLDSHQLRSVVACLCVGQITSWGILYYALPVLTTSIAEDTGWSVRAVTAAFSLGLGVNAVAGIIAGRAIDRWGPRIVMTAGSACAVPALALVALAPDYTLFILGWAATGVAMSAVLYAPSFAAVTGWAGTDPQRRLRALTVITLVGGLASTAFAPLAAVLVDSFGWRTTYLVLAAALAAITIPVHAIGLHHPWRSQSEEPAPPTAAARPATGSPHPRPDVSRQLAFWVLAAAFTLVAFAEYASVINLVPLLQEHGTSITSASVVLGLGGVGQVAGRLLWAPIAARGTLTGRTAAVFTIVGLTTGAFTVVSGPIAALIALSLLAGVARGAVTLLQATAISDRWGTHRFGRYNGLLTAPIMIASAAAPFAGAALATWLGSYALAFAVMAATALAAAALTPLTVPAITNERSAVSQNLGSETPPASP